MSVNSESTPTSQAATITVRKEHTSQLQSQRSLSKSSYMLDGVCM